MRRIALVLALGGFYLSATSCHRKKPRLVSEIHFGGDPQKDRQLRGIYPGVGGGWVWTGPVFAFALDPAASGKPVYLEMDFAIPEELYAHAPLVTLSAKVNGVDAGRHSYKAGRYFFACRVPAGALQRVPAEVEFTVDQTMPHPDTHQPVSLNVVSVGFKEYEQTAEFRDIELAKAHDAYEKVLKERDLRLPLEKQRELMRIFHDLPIWDSLWFQNVRIIKNPLDLWMLQQIAYEVRPDFVVETGTWFGGSALYWAHTLNGMGLENTRVFTVDIQDATNQGANSNPLWKKYVTFYKGSSTDPAIVARIAKQVAGGRVIVNLDSDHAMQHVLNELRLYAPMVSPGSYIAVEDTHLDGVPTHPDMGAGPMAAVLEFLKEDAGHDFEQDFTREAFVMTSYPGGFLRRKTRH
jgi:cephalosporin hydroxylase